MLRHNCIRHGHTCTVILVSEGPDGRRFIVSVVPPGSALDTDDTNPFGLLGWILSAIRGGGSKKWRVVVNERRPNGALGPTLSRELFDESRLAEQRAHDLRNSSSGLGLGHQTRLGSRPEVPLARTARGEPCGS